MSSLDYNCSYNSWILKGRGKRMLILSIKELANRATHALLAQELLEVTHETSWEREGFPLPVKRMPPCADGSITWVPICHRPIVILEYVQEYLSGEIKAR